MRLPPFRPRIAPGPLSDVIDLAGLACLDTAAWWCHPIAGMAVLGVFLLLIGWVVDREPVAQSR